MANVPRGAPKGKKSKEVFEDVVIDDLTVSTGLTMGTTDALTVDTIAAIAGKELVITGSTTLDVEVKLGDAAGTTDFHVADSAGVELFKVPSTGIIALEGGATLDNSTSNSILNITESTVKVTGAFETTGAITVPTTVAINTDTINSITGKALVLSGADGYDVKVKLGDDDGVESFIVEEVDGDDLFKVGSTGTVTLKGGAILDNVTSADELKITETGIKTVGAVKHIGEWSTRNAADDSMYNSIAASSGHERGMKVAYDIVSNDGGYFDALYANVRSGGVTGGELRAVEAKASVAHDLSDGAIATGVYAKVAVANAAQVDTAIGVDVLLEETGTGAITAGTGIRVQGGDGAIHNGIDLSGDYGLVALKMPSLAGAAITAATIAGAGAPAQGALTGDTGFVGLYKDSADSNAISAIFKYDGLYYHVKLTDTTDS